MKTELPSYFQFILKLHGWRGEGLVVLARHFEGNPLKIWRLCWYTQYVHKYIFSCSLHIKESREWGELGCLFYMPLKIYNYVILFVGLTTLGTFVNFDWLSVHTFQPLICIYFRGNFVCHYWGFITIHRSLSYPFISLKRMYRCNNVHTY